MKQRKRGSKSLDEAIMGGKGEDSPKVGRPPAAEPKKQCIFNFPVTLIEKINENCQGNKSAFGERVFKEYFERNGL